MSDNIKFDYSRAQNMLKSVTDCKSALEKLATRLNSAVNNAGNWWQGGSYEGYKESFAGANGGKSVIEGVAENTSLMGNCLISAVQTKKNWEQTGKSNF